MKDELNGLFDFLDRNIPNGFYYVVIDDEKINVETYKNKIKVISSKLSKWYEVKTSYEAKRLISNILAGFEDSIVEELFSSGEYNHKDLKFRLHDYINSDCMNDWTYSVYLNGYRICETGYNVPNKVEVLERIKKFIEYYDSNSLVFTRGGMCVVSRNEDGLIYNIHSCYGEEF